jgi:hypothetical protein
LRLTGSPTIRVGDVEVRPEHRGTDEEGRVWWWNGEEHSLPPEAMLVDTILRGYALLRAAGGIGAFSLPAYMQQFLKPESPPCECV